MKFPFIVIVPAMRVSGMAVFPFIFLKSKLYKQDNVLIRHETIHLKQELELLIVPFYILYLLNYLVNLVRYKSHNKAYFNIAFEREAYKHEADVNYLYQRKAHTWVKFLCP